MAEYRKLMMVEEYTETLNHRINLHCQIFQIYDKDFLQGKNFFFEPPPFPFNFAFYRCTGGRYPTENSPEVLSPVNVLATKWVLHWESNQKNVVRRSESPLPGFPKIKMARRSSPSSRKDGVPRDLQFYQC
ncbi:hypothetical protein HUJ05_002080 [Dendroctonus ponderosae]|nr:hypothetical protein HUJ05_002080 [Dendroctonus ponderosae]